VTLNNPDSDTTEADYYIDLRSRKGYDFEVARERCGVISADGSRHAFDRRTSRGATVWDTSIESIAPAIEPNALALPLVGGYRRFRAVFAFLSRMRTYRIEPAVVRTMQDPDAGAQLRSDGRNAASVLRQIQRRPEHAVRIRQLLEAVVPGTVDVRPKRHGNKLTLEFTQDRAGAEPVKFEAFSMSDGTLRVLGMIMAVLQRPAPSVLVVEEPEASMHPGALGSILDVLQLASQSMQVVVTTHSPDLLDAKWIEDRHLRILSWQNGSTRIGRASQAVRSALGKHLMGAGELLRSNALTSDEETDSDSP
jgi:predicted ATPase